jgi:hypothetical protein
MSASSRRFSLFGIGLALLVLGAVFVARSRPRAPERSAATAAPEPAAAAPPSLAGPAGIPKLATLPDRAPDLEPPSTEGEAGFGAVKAAIADCWSSKTCPAGSTCWMGDDGQLGCFNANCTGGPESVQQCGPERTCEVIDRRRGLRRCVAAGATREGGICQPGEFARARLACAPGLTCWRGHCRRVCDAKTGCDNGVCARVNGTDWACVPSCNFDSECKVEGWACVTLDERGARTCLRAGHGREGRACRPDTASCAAGERCDFVIKEDTLLSACRPRCDASRACPGGMACATTAGEAGGVCLRACDPQGRRCPAPESCVPVDAAGQTWGCRIAPYAERPGVHGSRAKGQFSDPVAEPR